MSHHRAAKYSLESFGVGFMVTSPGFHPAGHTCIKLSPHQLLLRYATNRFLRPFPEPRMRSAATGQVVGSMLDVPVPN